jgi:hypothetical protein
LAGATTISTAGGALSLVGINGGGANLTLNGGAGSVVVSGATSNVAAFTLANAGGATFGSVNATGGVTVTTATGTVDFSAGLTTPNLTVGAGAFGVRLVSANVTAATTLSNTGTVTLGGTSLFSGGVTRSGGVTAIGGVVRTNGATANFGSISVQSASTIDTTNNGGAPTGAAIDTGAIDGAQTLTLISGTTGTVGFSGAVGANAALAALDVTAAAINVSSGGVITTGAQTYAGALNLPGAGAVTLSSGGAVTALGTINIADGGLARIISNGTMSLGTISANSGAGSTLALDAGASGSLTVAGNVLGLQTLTLLQSGGATFNGTVGAANAAPGIPYTNIFLSQTNGFVTFNQIVNADTLYSDTSNFSLSLVQGGDIAQGTITNSGGLGLVLSGSTTFRNGLSAVLVPITLTGTLSSPGAAVPINKLNISGSATIDTTGGSGPADADITLTSVNGGGNLTLKAGGSAIVIDSIGTTSALGSVNATAGTITLNGSATTIGNQDWNGPVTLGGNLVTTGGGSITITGTTTLTAAVAIDTSTGNGAVSLAAVDVSGGPQSLSIKTGTGSLAITGGITGLSSLTLPSVGDTTFAQDLTVAGKLAIGTGSGKIDFQGLVTTTGLTAGAGTYEINFAKDVTINSTTAVDLQNAGLVTIGENFIADAGFIHDKGTTSFKGKLLQTNAGDITLGAISLAQSITLDTTNAGANSGGGAVKTGAISGIGTLTIKGGAAGAVSIGDSALDGISISGGVITLSDLKTSGAQSFAGTVVLTGAVVASAVTLKGSASVSNGKSASITTKASNGEILIEKLDGPGSLSLDAGTGTVNITGSIGGATALAGLDATGAVVSLPTTVKLSGKSSVTNAEFQNGGTIEISGGTFTLNKVTGAGLLASGDGKLAINDANFSAAVELKNTGGVDFTKTNKLDKSLVVAGPASVTGAFSAGGSVGFGGALTLSGVLSSTGPLSVAGASTMAGTVNVSGGLTTAAIRLTDALTVTTNGGAADIGSIEGPFALVVNAGTQGFVKLGAIGGGGGLTSVDVTAGNLTMASVTTKGDQKYILGQSATLSGDLIAGPGSTVSVFGGSLNLTSGTHAITVNGTNASNRILLGSVNGPGVLNMTALGGGVLIGASGLSDPLGGLSSKAAVTMVGATATSGDRARAEILLTQSISQLSQGGVDQLAKYLAGQTPLGAADLRSAGAQSYTGVGVFSGQISTVGAGAAINVNGPALLVGNSRFDSSAGGGDITIGALDSVVTYRYDVVLAAGSGRINLGAVGQDPPVGALTISSSGGTTLSGDVAARTVTINSAVTLGTNVTMVVDPATGSIIVTGAINGVGQSLTASALSGSINLSGGVGSATSPLLNVSLSGVNVNVSSVFANTLTINANQILGSYNANSLNLSANFADIRATLGGVADQSIFSKIRFGAAGTYLINGLDAIRVLQSSARGLEAQTLAQLLNSILNNVSSSSGGSDNNENVEGGKKSGTTVLIPGLLSQEAPRSAASEQGVPGLNQRFPGLPNTALW